jgi:hypothetical protein
VLLYDNVLWNLVYAWVASLPYEDFRGLVPILRRTFAQYEPPERRKLGEKAKAGLLEVQEMSSMATVADPMIFDEAAARKAALVVQMMLG